MGGLCRDGHIFAANGWFMQRRSHMYIFMVPFSAFPLPIHNIVPDCCGKFKAWQREYEGVGALPQSERVPALCPWGAATHDEASPSVPGNGPKTINSLSRFHYIVMRSSIALSFAWVSFTLCNVYVMYYYSLVSHQLDNCRTGLALRPVLDFQEQYVFTRLRLGAVQIYLVHGLRT